MAGRFDLLRSNKAKDEQSAGGEDPRSTGAEIAPAAEEAPPPVAAQDLTEKAVDLAAAETEWKAEADERLAEAKATWQREADERLSSLEAEWQAEKEGRLAATKVERQAEADDRLAAAETEWKAEADRRFAFVAAAEAEWQAEADERLAEAKAARQREADERLAESKAAWQLKADERFASARTKWEQDAFERLSSLGAEWKAEADNRLAAARTEWQAEADKDLSAARTGWSQQAAQLHGAADMDQGSNTEAGAASGIGEEFAELFAQHHGVEDQGPEAAKVPQDPSPTDEKTAGVKRVFGRPWMWATAAAIVLGLVFAPSLTPVLDTVKSKLVPKEPPVAATEVLYVDTDIANIREKASTNSRIVSRVEYASKVTEVQRKGQWVKVITDGGKKPVGWIHASLLTTGKSQRR